MKAQRWNKEFNINGLTAEENKAREVEVDKCHICGKPALVVKNRKGYCRDHKAKAVNTNG